MLLTNIIKEPDVVDIASQRAHFIAVARSWIHTPYHDNARIKQGGCDCLGFIYGAAREAELVGDIEIPRYSPQDNLHEKRDKVTGERYDDESYLDGLLVYCDEVPGPPERQPLPGDLVIWKVARKYFHTAIIENWPVVLHCHKSLLGVGREDTAYCSWLNFISERVPDEGKPRPRKFLVLKAWNL